MYPGVFIWEDSGKVANYTNWAEPQSGGGSSCVLKTYKKELPGWQPATCSLSNYGNGYGEQHALCQRKN